MTRDQVAAVVAEAFADAVSAAVAGGRRFRCAVPGGSVATTVFPRIARCALPWRSVDVFLADERMVPVDHPESNALAITEHWLKRVTADPPRLHLMPTQESDVDAAARRAADELCDVAGSPPRLDVVLLGVGPDGHIASLFPDLPGWRRSSDWVIGVRGAPKPPPERLSLGLATIAHARELWFVAFGAEKARVLREAREHPASSLPVAVAARSGPAVRWYLDAAASGAAADL